MNILIGGIMLQIFMLILKLTETINWHWLIVLIPYEVILILYFVGLYAGKKKTKEDEWEKAREEWKKLSKK